jgi:hypothetical protein
MSEANFPKNCEPFFRNPALRPLDSPAIGALCRSAYHTDDIFARLAAEQLEIECSFPWIFDDRRTDLTVRATLRDSSSNRLRQEGIDSAKLVSVYRMAHARVDAFIDHRSHPAEYCRRLMYTIEGDVRVGIAAPDKSRRSIESAWVMAVCAGRPD